MASVTASRETLERENRELRRKLELAERENVQLKLSLREMHGRHNAALVKLSVLQKVQKVYQKKLQT